MGVTHVFDTPPEGVAADWTMPQNWSRFSATEHALWDRLVERQMRMVEGSASERFVAGLKTLGLAGRGIPDLDELNARLTRATGWTVVAVPGAIPNEPFFRHLSERRFPMANFLRPPASLDYSEEPDMFHDLFGHLPMLADPVFARFMVAYGHAGLRAERLGAADFLGRLYLYTVEFGLVAERGGLRAYGAGLLSSYSETRHALRSPEARRLRFDLPEVMRRDYVFDEFQKAYFVIDSFEELLRVTAETDFAPIYDRLHLAPPLAPDAVSPADRPYEPLGFHQ